MKTFILVSACLGLTGCGLTACASLPHAFDARNGHSEFGVDVGMTRQQARNVLLDRADTQFVRGGSCRVADTTCAGADTMDHYRVDSFPQSGTLDLYISGDRVNRVRWTTAEAS